MQTVPAASKADWERLVIGALGEKPLSSLDAEIAEGVSVPPLSPATTMRPLWSRGGASWTRLAWLDRADSAALASALATGADGVALVLGGAPAAASGGIAPPALAALLQHIELDRCAVRFSAGVAADEVFTAVRAALAQARLDAGRVSIAFGLDPFGALAAGLIDPAAIDDTLTALAEAAVRNIGEGHRGPILSADARLAHAAGGDAVDELAFALAGRAALLRRLDSAGLAPARLADAVDVALAADVDQFVTIAKFRAMRLLDARLLAAAGLPPSALRLHGETSTRMLAAIDSRSNIIRATIAALSAALGGADSLTILPWSLVGPADADAHRLALTTQAILAEEAGLARVDDPAAGSGTIDGITLALAHAAWTAFQRIEEAGGLAASLTAGTMQRRIIASARAAEERLAGGEATIIGVTLHRPSGEAPAHSPTPPPPARGFVPLVASRRAASFEGESA